PGRAVDRNGQGIDERRGQPPFGTSSCPPIACEGDAEQDHHVDEADGDDEIGVEHQCRPGPGDPIGGPGGSTAGSVAAGSPFSDAAAVGAIERAAWRRATAQAEAMIKPQTPNT